ncbi:hypothetical protein IW261DRAFT_1574915 [Armillaria novae-zelandiae]|uniref:Uncharacterized protein n=1 Tax=Armillaria novae-zelandiae TaxID=153914 RepID=A0AA39NHT0_9AGAR|nr:hypothetical protein IW261DRAFT_1574915 [Armillaria novae-zelandiae]
MEEQQPSSSTQDLLIPSPDTTLAPTKLTAAQILNYFWMSDGLLDSPRLLKSYQALNKMLWSTQLQVNKLIEKNRLLEILPTLGTSPTAVSLQSTLGRMTLKSFKHAKSEEQGLYAEVYAMLKEEHHFFFKRNYSPAVKKFIRSASDGCSACVSHVKHEAFYTIFGGLLPPSATVKGFDPFSDPVCQQLLGFDAQKKVYSTLPPIFWLNTILLAIFFSATSINERKVIKKKPTNAVLWNLERITPGTITFAAIIACYVLSGDEHFDKHGGRSLIPYVMDFKFYKMTIIKNLNKTHMMETIATFNCCLFEDDDPFDVQVVDETIAHNSEPALAATADVAVDELASSIAGVTLDTAAS